MKSEGLLYVWIAGDDSTVLGLGLTPTTAHADAVRRHGEPAEGYSSRWRVDSYPAEHGVNPVAALVRLLDRSGVEAPPLEARAPSAPTATRPAPAVRPAPAEAKAPKPKKGAEPAPKSPNGEAKNAH